MVRYCAACDDEFRPDIIVCSDCGGALILQPEGLGARGARVPNQAEGSPASDDWRTALDDLPISSLVPVRTFDSLSDLEPAVAAFAAIGLPSRILVQSGRYILLIRPEGLAEAQAALHGALVDADDGADPAFDVKAGRYSNCPACDAGFTEEFTGACQECGLELSAPRGTLTVPEAE